MTIQNKQEAISTLNKLSDSGMLECSLKKTGNLNIKCKVGSTKTVGVNLAEAAHQPTAEAFKESLEILLGRSKFSMGSNGSDIQVGVLLQKDETRNLLKMGVHVPNQKQIESKIGTVH